MSKLILYSYFQSSAAYRVRIALNFKAISYEYKAVDLVGRQQHADDYAGLNPMREVPTLVTPDGSALGQSMAIFLWLDREYKAKPLFPEDSKAMARVVQFCENINAGIHPIQNLKVRQELEKRYRASTEERENWCAYWIERGFTSLEKFLEKSSGKFCFGDQVTAADMFLVPQVFNARRYKVNMNAFPLITKVDKSCNELEAFVKAHPSVQPDSPQ